MQLGRNEEARVAFDRAIALANTPAEAAHIRMHLDRLIRRANGEQASRRKKFTGCRDAAAPFVLGPKTPRIS